MGVYRDGDFVMAGNARAVASFAEVPAWLPGSSGESPYDRSGSGGADMRPPANTFGVRHLGFEGVW